MTHQLPFSYFKEFILENADHYDVYMNLYCLIELYRNKVSTLLVKAKNIKIQMQQEGNQFDLKDINDPEFNTAQLMVGRSMLNMLEYIRQNYVTHFKDLKITNIEDIDIAMLAYNNGEMTDTQSIFTGSEKTNHLSMKLTSQRSNENPDSKSEIIRESNSDLVYDKSRVSGKKGADPMGYMSLLSKQSISTKDIYLICGAGQLEPYKKFITLDMDKTNNQHGSSDFSDSMLTISKQSGQAFADAVRKESTSPVDTSIFCKPLSFDQFFIRCKDRLNHVFINQFKKDKMFNDLLFKICETETKQQFLERAQFIKPSFVKENKSNGTSGIHSGQ